MNTTSLDFESLTSALEYVTNCPMCHTQLTVQDDDPRFCSMVDGELFNSSRTYSIKIPLHGKSVSIIHILNSSYIDFIGSNDRLYTKHAIANSNSNFLHHILGVQVGCPNKNCGSYYYTFNFTINDVNSKIADFSVVTNITLNHEYIIFEDGDTNYEILSSYASNITKYMVTSKDHYLDKKTIEIPFIKLDLDSPKKTLEKVQNLIIFT